MIPSTLPALAALFVGVIVALGAFAAWVIAMSRSRLIQDTPTRKVAGIVLGPNELAGVPTRRNVTEAPYSGKECVWWETIHYEWRKRGDTYQWVRVNERSGGPRYFEYKDDSGSVWVRTKGASVKGVKSYDGADDGGRKSGAIAMATLMGSGARLNGGDMFSTAVSSRGAGGASLRRRKVVETIIPVGQPLYLFGTAVLEPHAHAPSIIDDPDGDSPFILYVGTERQAMNRERITQVIAAVLAVLATIVVGVAPSSGDKLVNGDITIGGVSWIPAIGLLTLLAMAMLVAFAASAYNGLIKLTHAVEKAWSLIDVELRRRHDLIPQLVQTVSAHGTHEAGCQSEIAALRSAISPDLPPKPDDEAVRSIGPRIEAETDAVQHLIARAEAYPDLRAHEEFMNLQRQLVETEHRIELARHFYNNSVESLRSRSQVLPGAAIAWAFEMDVEAEFAEEAEAALAEAPPELEPVA